MGTSLYYLLVVAVHLFVWRRSISARFLACLLPTLGAGAGAALLWPYYDYLTNLNVFLERIRNALVPQTALLRNTLFEGPFAAASILRWTVPGTRLILGCLVVAPLLGSGILTLVDLYGYGLLGVGGLLLLVRKRAYLFPVWWSVGGLLYLSGLVDPIRIILASSFALFAGAGVLIDALLVRERAIALRAGLLAALAGGGFWFAVRWEAPGVYFALLAAFSLCAALVVLVKPFRRAFPIAAALFLLIPLALKWEKIERTETIAPKAFIEKHVPEWEVVLVVEPNHRWMNKVISGLQNRRGIFLGESAHGLLFYANRYETPYVLFYRSPLTTFGMGYDLLDRDQESVLIRLHGIAPGKDP